MITAFEIKKIDHGNIGTKIELVFFALCKFETEKQTLQACNGSYYEVRR